MTPALLLVQSQPIVPRRSWQPRWRTSRRWLRWLRRHRNRADFMRASFRAPATGAAAGPLLS